MEEETKPQPMIITIDVLKGIIADKEVEIFVLRQNLRTLYSELQAIKQSTNTEEVKS